MNKKLLVIGGLCLAVVLLGAKCRKVESGVEAVDIGTLEKGKIAETIKQAKEEMGWVYYDYDAVEETGDKDVWTIGKLSDRIYLHSLSVYSFSSDDEYRLWKNGACKTSGKANIEMLEDENIEVGCCFSRSDSEAAELRMYLQGHWGIVVSSDSKDCSLAKDYLNTFWKLYE